MTTREQYEAAVELEPTPHEFWHPTGCQRCAYDPTPRCDLCRGTEPRVSSCHKRHMELFLCWACEATHICCPPGTVRTNIYDAGIEARVLAQTIRNDERRAAKDAERRGAAA